MIQVHTDILDKRISKIIEICRFEEDPNWEIISQLFNGVTFDKYHQILINRDKVINNKLNEDHDQVPSVENMDQLWHHCTFKGGRLVTKQPIVITGNGFSSADVMKPGELDFEKVKNPFAKSRIVFNRGYGMEGNIAYLGSNVSLLDVSINTPTYVQDGADLEYSTFQGSRQEGKSRFCFVGANTVISNVREIRGSFISGGPIRDEGRKQICMHANSLNNAIIAAYSGASIGFDIMNHPVANNYSYIINPISEETMYISGPENRKLPVLIGLEAVIGAKSLLHSGSIIGANTVLRPMNEIDGLVIKEDIITFYIPARDTEDHRAGVRIQIK